MPNTPFYDWPTPDPAGANQYPEDMAALADAIETTLKSLPALPALATFEEVLDTVNPAVGTVNLDLSAARNFRLVATGNVIIALTNIPVTGGRVITVTLRLEQDGVGGHTWTLPAGADWGLAGAPTFTSTLSKHDIVVLKSYDNFVHYDAFFGGAGGF